MNLNELAVRITKKEGLKKQLSVGQVKEVIGCLGTELRIMDSAEACETVSAILKRAGLRRKK